MTSRNKKLKKNKKELKNRILYMIYYGSSNNKIIKEFPVLSFFYYVCV